jgi:hypothetical protein
MNTSNKRGETFTINLDLSGNGVDLELVVSRHENYYLVNLDGLTVSKLEHKSNSYPKWRQVEGRVDQDTVNAIGEAIETKIA